MNINVGAVKEFVIPCETELPEQFQRCEYIRSNDKCGYVDSGIVLDSSMNLIEVYAELALTETNPSDACAFGSAGVSMNLKEGFNSGNLGEIDVNVGEYHSYYYKRDLSQNYVYYEIDETPIKDYTSSYWYPGDNILIFDAAYYNTPYYPSDIKMRSIKIYINGNLERYFVPCYRVLDGVIGMYDVVRNGFHARTIKDTGEFTKGSDATGTGYFQNANVKRVSDENGDVIWNALPKEYQEVEYIQSSGSQYIDTGVQLGGYPFKALVGFSLVSLPGSSREAPIISNWTSTYRYFNCFIDGYASNVLDIYCNGHNRFPSSAVVDTKYDIVVERDSSNRWKLSDNTVSRSFEYTPGLDNNTSVKLLMRGDGATSYTSARLYYTMIYKNGDLVRNLVPCYRKADSVIGMYDLVNGTFYTNAGSGTFTKGNDV